MRRYLVLLLVGMLILFRLLRRNPVFALIEVVLFDRKVRRLAAGLLFALIRNPHIRRLILRWLLRR